MTEALRAKAPPAVLTDDEFHRLGELLYDRSGLVFGPPKRQMLDGRVARRMAAVGVDTGTAYLDLLRSPHRGPGELLELLDAVTTHETSFFRNRPQLNAFRQYVLAPLVERQRASVRPRLRIWSAGCSSGEEPYSLAMLVLEVLGDEVSRWDVRISGTDLAKSVIEKARQGEYGRYSFRGTPAYYVQKYFEVLGPDRYRVGDAPRRLVAFEMLNFQDEVGMARMQGFHVVFCRNALIYFDRPAKKRFVAHFHRSLVPGGYLFIGHSESLHGVSDAFKLIHFPGALAYQKPPAHDLTEHAHGT